MPAPALPGKSSIKPILKVVKELRKKLQGHAAKAQKLEGLKVGGPEAAKIVDLQLKIKELKDIEARLMGLCSGDMKTPLA